MKARLLALALTLTTATELHAQIRASEMATFTQMIDGTKISMSYSRPRGRGRDPLFGSVKSVRWDEVWTPGANYATTFEVNRFSVRACAEVSAVPHEATTGRTPPCQTWAKSK